MRSTFAFAILGLVIAGVATIFRFMPEVPGRHVQDAARFFLGFGLIFFFVAVLVEFFLIGSDLAAIRSALKPSASEKKPLA